MIRQDKYLIFGDLLLSYGFFVAKKQHLMKNNEKVVHKMDELLYVIPANSPKEKVVSLLKEHPEIKFVSLVGVDLAGNDTDEKIESWLPCCYSNWNDFAYFDQKGFRADTKDVFDCACNKET